MDDISTIIEAIKESMVVIKLPNQGRGSGFFVNDKGLFITNKHTVELDTFIKIRLYNEYWKSNSLCTANRHIVRKIVN